MKVRKIKRSLKMVPMQFFLARFYYESLQYRRWNQ